MSKRWLFITYAPDPKRPALDASARYRCFSRAEDLRARGIEAAVISQQRFEREPPLHYDVYVFHRPWYSQDFEGLVEFLRARGRCVLADYDEPAFGAPLGGPKAPPFPELNAPSASPERRFEHALKMFRTVTAATRPLADWIERVHPEARVEVIPTGLRRSWREAADALEGEGTAPAKRRVGLFPLGSDLVPNPGLVEAVISEGLDRPGGLLIDGATARAVGARLGDAEVLRSGTSRRSALARCHTLLLPCEATAVTACASAVSYFEAAWFGCRVFVPPLPDFAAHEGKGLTVVSSEAAWGEAMRRAFQRPPKEEVEEAKTHARACGLSETHTDRLIRLVEARVS
jgi:hypothetical protein